MTWENSRPKLQPRAKAIQLTDRIWLVAWKGGDYLIQSRDGWINLVTDEPIGCWIIRRRDNPIPIHEVIETEGFGKEEPIDWIEKNC